MIEILALIILSIGGMCALIWGMLSLAVYVQERTMK